MLLLNLQLLHTVLLSRERICRDTNERGTQTSNLLIPIVTFL
jgi:hypothetical protein